MQPSIRYSCRYYVFFLIFCIYNRTETTTQSDYETQTTRRKLHETRKLRSTETRSYETNLRKTKPSRATKLQPIHRNYSPYIALACPRASARTHAACSRGTASYQLSCCAPGHACP